MPIRPAHLAGQWYPGNKEACERFFAEVQQAPPGGQLSGAIVPHAGWRYSGRRSLRGARWPEGVSARTPTWWWSSEGTSAGDTALASCSRDGFDTPLGSVAIAKALAHDVESKLDCDIETAGRSYDDNAVEVIMPMVRHLWPDAPALLLGVPPVLDAERIGSEVASLAARRGFAAPVFIGSTDLTHYGPNYAYEPPRVRLRRPEVGQGAERRRGGAPHVEARLRRRARMCPTRPERLLPPAQPWRPWRARALRAPSRAA